ncbi:MAG TPA: hypothetical protein VHR45_12465 [Thermoanaerobaculia bacterium]|nr:hypothetical protein [Thermoanaerobaculia bacterium]
MSRWVGWLFAALAFLYLVPFWAVPYLPTTDGPCHLFNAWVLRHYADPAQAEWLGSIFAIDGRPVPNWFTHLAMALLMWVVPPLVAEKLLVSGLVLLLLGGLWYLAGSVDPERRFYAFLGFPLVWTVLLQLGLYNFCASLGFFLLAVGFYWRRREGLDLRSALALNLLLLSCYLSHILSAILALSAIAVLWAATLSRANWRRHLLTAAALAPQAVLPLWFVATQGGGVIPASGSFAILWRYLLRLFATSAFAEEGNRIGRILGELFVLLLVFSVLHKNVRWGRPARPPGGERRWWRRLPVRLQREDSFLLLCALFALLYFVSPEGTAGGTLLKQRLSLFPFLILVPWLSAPPGRWGRGVLIGGLSLLALADLSFAWRCYRAAAPRVAAFVHGLDGARPRSIVLPLVFDRGGACSRVGILDHATGYAAVAKGLIDWDNYEAMTSFFPLRFRPALHHSGLYQVEANPLDLDVHQLDPQIDYVYCWRMPPHSKIARRLDRNWLLVAEDADSRLYQRQR